MPRIATAVGYSERVLVEATAEVLSLRDGRDASAGTSGASRCR
jgi:hypothetical protein